MLSRLFSNNTKKQKSPTYDPTLFGPEFRSPVTTDDTAMLLASLRTDGAPAQLGRAGSTVVMASPKASSTQTQPALRIDTEEAADTVQQPTSQFVAGEVGLPLPPERPFAIGDAGFRPQFAALNSTKPTSNPKPAVETEQTEVAVPQAATVPLPPVRPGQFSAADASPLTEKSAAPAKTVSPVTVPTNGFVPVTAPAQRWNKGA